MPQPEVEDRPINTEGGWINAEENPCLRTGWAGTVGQGRAAWPRPYPPAVAVDRGGDAGPGCASRQARAMRDLQRDGLADRGPLAFPGGASVIAAVETRIAALFRAARSGQRSTATVYGQPPRNSAPHRLHRSDVFSGLIRISCDSQRSGNEFTTFGFPSASCGLGSPWAGGFHHSLFIISSPPLRNRIETAPDHGHDFGIEACHRPFRMSAEPGVANQNRKE